MDNINNSKCTEQIVDMDMTLAYVTGLLEKYDRDLEKGILGDQTPYYDKIYMQGKYGKTIEIPYDVQQEAIKIWNIKKLHNNYVDEKKSIEKEISIISQQLDQLDVEEDSPDEENYTYILIAIIIIMITCIGIYFYKKQQ